MQIIQSIRDKGAAIVIGVIALSLIGFLLMDARPGGGGLFGGGSRGNTMGKVNGEEIGTEEFNKKYELMQEQYGGSVSGAQANQLRQGVWDQLVAEKIFEGEIEKVGITFSPAELSSKIYSAEEAPRDLLQAFTDSTGVYNVEKVREWWKTVRKSKEDNKQMVDQRIIEPLRIGSLFTKYNSMMQAGAYYPSWMQQKEMADNNTYANISYAYVPYNVISDSAIKVTDADITDYVNKNKELFKQEDGRMISYVSFSADPSLADSNNTRQLVAGIRADFAKDSNAKAFVNLNASTIPYYDNYVLKSKMQMGMKDSISSLSKGAVFGPYIDGGNYALAKMIDSRVMPDSIKCRHILVKIADTKGEKRSDSAARKLIDSIRTAIAGGADFNQMVLKYSDDEGSNQNGGEYEFSSTSQLVDSFYRTVFYEPVGTKRIVKGESQDYVGYHYIEVLKQWKQEPAYKVAYIARQIEPSKETINGANIAATKLAASARNAKQFDDYLAKNGLQKVSNPTAIKENDFAVGSLENARELVRWAYKADQGEVSPEAFSLGNNFVVAVLDKVVKAGVPDARTARPLAEQEVRNRKKAEEIMKKIPANATVDATAAAYSRPVLTAGADSSLTFGSYIVKELGPENKVIGAAFNKEYQNKASAPIVGSTGVYVVKVNSYGNKPAATPEVQQQQAAMRLQSMKQQAAGWFEALKKQATIKDNRSDFN